MASHYFHTVSAARVVSALMAGRRLPARSVALTFDDGYVDMFRTVFPALRSRGMTATFFVCPALLGKPRYMTWRQVRVMARHGMDIEAHTLTHPDLTAVPAAQRWNEIDGSRKQLRSRLGVTASVFAYPYGHYNARVLADVRRAGYLAAFGPEQGWLLRPAFRLTLPRIYIDRDDSLSQFSARLTGNLAVVAEDPT